MNTSFGLFVGCLRARYPIALGAFLAILAIPLIYSVTVPNLQDDPAIPRNRVTLLLGCLLASLLCAFLRPLEHIGETLAVRSMIYARFTCGAIAMTAILGATQTLTFISSRGSPIVMDPIARNACQRRLKSDPLAAIEN